MTRDSEALSVDRKLVVVFDICSSTTILENLKQTDNLAEWRNLLISLKQLLLQEGTKLGMEPYKFIGDGWILLFEDTVPKDSLCNFLTALSKWFDTEFENNISKLLTQQPTPIGLMFGIDSGDLIRLEMNEQWEYLGRPINVASRLQGQTKELAGGPSYKALFSKNSFYSPPKPPEHIKVEPVVLSLRNISHGEKYEALVFETSEKSLRAPTGKNPGGARARTARQPVPVAARAPARRPPRAAESAATPREALRSQIIVTATGVTGISQTGATEWSETGQSAEQQAIVIQFTNEAAPGGINSQPIVRASLVYRDEQNEILRVAAGGWLDEVTDLAGFKVEESHRLIVGLLQGRELIAIEQRRTPAQGGGEHCDAVRRLMPGFRQGTVRVRLTDISSHSTLYEGYFEISVNPPRIRQRAQ